ncbi:MAG: hypothetical protein DRI61_09655, partial [Chloroflexi bacterium]
MMRKIHLLVLFAYLLIALIMSYPLVLQFASAIPGDGFDGWQNYWNLWWVKKALLEEHTSPYFTDYLYYPTGVSLLFHTLNPFNGLITLPVQLLFGLTVAYNVVVIFSFVMAAYGTFLLAKYVLVQGGQQPAASSKQAFLTAFVAGLIYAFSPFHFAHLLGHMQVFSLEWVPFFALYLLRITNHETRINGGGSLRQALVACSLVLILASLCDWYQTFYLGIFTALYLLWLWRRKALTGGVFLRVGAVFVPFAILLSPLLMPMVMEAVHYNYMVMPLQHLELLSADLLAFFTPSEFHPLWGRWAGKLASHFTASLSERTVFLGYVPLILAGTALWKRWRDENTRFWFLVGVVFFVLALGPVLHIGGQTEFTPWKLRIPLPYALLQH